MFGLFIIGVIVWVVFSCVITVYNKAPHLTGWTIFKVIIFATLLALVMHCCIFFGISIVFWAICWAFNLTIFSWKIAFGIWLILDILVSIFKH